MIGQAAQMAAGAVESLFNAKAAGMNAKGLRLQAKAYGRASEFAFRNVDYVKASTEIQAYQLQRKQFMSFGQTEADVAAGGFGESGSAGDLMRMSQENGAMEMAVLKYQGKINEEGYQVQGESYAAQRDAALYAAKAADAAAKGGLIAGIIKGGGALLPAAIGAMK